MTIITEEMRFRKRLCDCALKYGATKAARRYHTNRQFVYRQLKKYDGTVRSLALKSRRPHNSPNAHTEEELKLIKDMYRINGIYGLAEVYVRCLAKGYARSFWSMCRQIRVKGYKSVEKRRKSYTKYIKLEGKYPVDKVQVDIKHVPQECITFPAYEYKYYQIIAIDEFSRKRILKIVKEKSTYETSKFLIELENKLGFKINTIQVNNGYEFVNDGDKTDKTSAFEKVAQKLGMKIKRIRPYSPWQNGKVERSHREDSKIMYNRKIFTREKDLIKQIYKHQNRYNNTAKISLNFKTPNQVVKEYFSKCNICLDN